MEIINEKYLSEEMIRELAQQFNIASPYPFIMMDNFLKEELAETLHSQFPDNTKLDIHWNGLNENKSEGCNFENFDEAFRVLKQTIMSPEMSQWIEKTTGVKDSIVTDDKLGCGVHQGKDGSFLDVHVDFNMHHTANKYRRLNLLIYLNKNWKTEEYGGELELWNADMTNCDHKIAPLFNRAVIFETNHYSYHGYSKISLPEGETRKSFYTYFYTDDQGNQKSYHDTTFKSRPDEDTSKKVKTALKENIKNGVKKTFKKLGIKF
ncbi:MAG: 2OG-Fe(II) oxygenase [Cytophagales bacterium]|nr:2OG-Fe(II) oxygenase [Cytophagales bacterium]